MNKWLDTNDWMTKNVIFAPINDRGECVINWITSEDKSLIKIASAGKSTYHSKIAEFIENVKPRKDMACCVISALGSYEVWGQNVNGDRFPRIMFQEGQHKTYERNGFPYKHHLNKPHLGHPQYGEKVVLAEFNPRMDRVELIVWYDLTKDTSLLNDIENGNVGVSMGMKTPYDTCTIIGCGNVAKTPDEYCIHSHKEKRRGHGYYMGMIMHDGQQVGRWNRYANFFDISRVIIPAWQPGRILEKVASRQYNIPAQFLEGSAFISKNAETEKNADMIKNVQPLAQQANQKAVEFMNQANTIQRTEPRIDNGTLNRMSEGNNLKSILSTMVGLGIMPKPEEFQRIVLVKAGKKDLADKLEKVGCIFTDYEASTPTNPNLIEIDYQYCSEKIAMDLEPYLSSRSCLRPILEKRLEKIAGQNIAMPQYPIQEKQKDRNLGREAFRSMLGIGGLYALLRSKVIGDKFNEIAGKKLIPTLEELGQSGEIGSKAERTFEKFFSGSSGFVKLMVLAAVGSVAAGTYQKLKEPKLVGNYDQPLDSPSLINYNGDYKRELLQRNTSPFVKIGFNLGNVGKLVKSRTMGSTLKRSLIGLPAFYMIAGTLEAKRKQDVFNQEPEGTVGGFLRKHPGIAAGSFTFAPQLKDLAMGIVKKGSVGEDVRDWAVFGALGARNPALGITGGIADALLFNATGKAYNAIINRFKEPRINKLEQTVRR